MVALTIYDADISSLKKRAFDLFCEKVRSCKKEVITIALCGGRFAGEFYKLLSQLPKDLPLSKLRFFLFDERMPLSDRNEVMIRESFFDVLVEKNVLSSSQLYLIPEGFSLEETARHYTQSLRQVSSSLSFDIIVASMGEDGHIASLFPGHSTMRSGELGFGIEPLSPKAPNERLTVLPQSIRQSNTMLLFAVGESKQMAYTLFLTAKDDKMCPALLVHQVRKGFVFTDLKA